MLNNICVPSHSTEITVPLYSREFYINYAEFSKIIRLMGNFSSENPYIYLNKL